MQSTTFKIWNRRDLTWLDVDFGNDLSQAEKYIKENTKIYKDLDGSYMEDDYIIVMSDDNDLNTLLQSIIDQKDKINIELPRFGRAQRDFSLAKSAQFHRIWNINNTVEGPIIFKKKREAENFIKEMDTENQPNWKLLDIWEDNPPDTHFK